MFSTIRGKVSLLAVLEKDLNQEFKQTGQNYVLVDDKDIGCPFCGHHDCFKVREDSTEEAFYKCFSCGAYGDVIKWREERKSISPKQACTELAEEFGIDLPHGYSPVQEVFSLAARYYSQALLVECNKPYVILGNKTPLEYQTAVRRHSEAVLRRFNVGWSDGGLADYLSGVGFEEALLLESGLVTKKQDKPIRDFLPTSCFIYPHYVRDRVSHFTFKDPLKKLAYQLPKKYTLNGWAFYNQDSVSTSDTIIVVEGENDLLSVADTGKVPAVVATIGQLSVDQLDWMRKHLASKKVLTIFDPDSAGDTYRVKVEKNRKQFQNLAHVLPPNGKDIDELLSSGGDIEQVIKGNLVKVDISDIKPGRVSTEQREPVASVDIPWEQVTTTQLQSTELPPENSPVATPATTVADHLKASLIEGGLTPPVESTGDETAEDSSLAEVELDSYGGVEQRHGAYWRIKFTEGVPTYTQISDFVIRLKNVFKLESGERHREIVVVRDNGKISDPIMIDDDVKVTVKMFKVMMARAADALFTGTDGELSAVWKIVYSQQPEKEVLVPRVVGRHEKYRAWVFRDTLLSYTGEVTTADSNGIFWTHGRNIGIQAEPLAGRQSGDTDDRTSIPSIHQNIGQGETTELLKHCLLNVSKNLCNEGKACLLLGWTYASVYSDLIFEMNRGFPFLFFWGTNGKGKTTLAKWVTQDFFGMEGRGCSTSIPNLGSAAGFSRTAEYYSGLPLIIDEVRSDDLTRQYQGLFRSFYDKEARVLGIKESFGVQIRKPRANFVFIGEDQFEDPATRERCIPIRIPVVGRELVESYEWMEDNKHLFPNIAFRWIQESCEELTHPDKREALKAEIRSLDKVLRKAGCSQRTSKNWAAVGVFSKRLADLYIPDFNFTDFLINTSVDEVVMQGEDTTISQFWNAIEAIRAKEATPITDKHIMCDKFHGKDVVNIWYPAVFWVVQNEFRGRFTFSKNAVKSAIREEPYYVCEDRKVPMGMDGARRLVLTLDLETCPDNIRNIALAN